MKAIVVALQAALLLVFSTTAGFAAERYYIVLGSESSEEEAMQEWRDLSTRFADVLKDVPFDPQAVLQSDNRVVTRVQAGPFEARYDAQKICNRLFEDNVACFILEAEIPPPPPEPKVSEQPAALPWLAAPEVVEVAAPAAPKEKGGLINWLFGSDAPPAQTPIESRPLASVPPEQAEVEVAEAIRVPLSNAAQEKPAPKAEPVFEKKPELVGEAGWLNVHAFATEENAQGFWQQVRETSPALVAGLRVRVVRPLMKNDRPTVSLNVGPFASRADAEAFCKNGIEPVDRALTCRFGQVEPQGAFRNVAAARSRRSEAYAARRAHLASRQEQVSGASQPMISSMAPSRMYWVQVVSAASQIDALNAWKAMRADHADLLDGLRMRISTSLLGNSGYVIRVGPVSTNGDAITLCNSLKNRGIDCRVYSNM